MLGKKPYLCSVFNELGVCCWNLSFLFYAMTPAYIPGFWVRRFHKPFSIKMFKVFLWNTHFIVFGGLTPNDWTSKPLLQSFNLRSFFVIFSLKSVDLEKEPKSHLDITKMAPKMDFVLVCKHLRPVPHPSKRGVERLTWIRNPIFYRVPNPSQHPVYMARTSIGHHFSSVLSKTCTSLAHPPKNRNTICEHNWWKIVPFFCSFGFGVFAVSVFSFWRDKNQNSNRKNKERKQDHTMQTRQPFSLATKKKAGNTDTKQYNLVV